MPQKKPIKKDTWEPLWLQKMHAPSWVVLILAIIFILRIPSFFSPYYYGDEMAYLATGEAITRGVSLYSGISADNPPLIYVVAAITGKLFWFRAILALWMMITTIFFWKLANSLFPKDAKIVVASTVAFAILTTIPLFEGQIANVEIFALGPTIIAFYVLLTKKLSPKNIILAGILLSISVLFSFNALLGVVVILFLWIIQKNLPLVSGLILIPILFMFNSSSLIIIKSAILVSGLVILYSFRKRLSWQFVFITSWLFVSLFAATLSENPYPHLLIQTLPAVSLFVGILLAAQSLEQSLAIIPIFILLLVVAKVQFLYYSTTSYYQNFLYFAGGSITKEDYYKSFDDNSLRNYKIAEYLRSSSKRDDKILVWGDAVSIYALSERLSPLKQLAASEIAAHSTAEETYQTIVNSPPKFVVVLPSSPEFPLLHQYLQDRYLLVDDVDGAKIWKLISFSVQGLLK